MFSGNWDITSHRWAGVLFGHRAGKRTIRSIVGVVVLYLEHVRERKWLVPFVITPLLLGIVEPQACYLPNDPCLNTQHLRHSFPWRAWAPSVLAANGGTHMLHTTQCSHTCPNPAWIVP